MRVPGWFAKQLDAEFDRQIRVRWSDTARAFQVERRIRRSSFAPHGVKPGDDEAIRIVDGFDLVCEVAGGDRLPCPRCGRTVSLPVREMREAKCPACGRVFRAVYWPLGDALLQHLRYIDPVRGGIERVFEDADKANFQLERMRRRDLWNHGESVWKEDYNRLVGIPSVGYTGREKTWQVTHA